MEGAEPSRYISQLKAEFDSCDTTETGFLDREELTALCQKLQLDAQRPLLLQRLLGEHTYARVNFEEFQHGLVAVLSPSLDFSASEDDSSYLDPVVPDEVKPKFVKGTKRYGRRTRPDRHPDAASTGDSDDSPPAGSDATDSSPAGVRRAKVRRSTSLDSVESLKSDEETGSQKNFQSKGPQQEEAELRGGGGADRDVLMAAGDHVTLDQLDVAESGVSSAGFQLVLHGSAPICCSTPMPRGLHRSQAAPDEHSARRTAPAVLTATVGQRILSRLDDGSGCSSPEGVVALWAEEGIKNSRDILQTLDFSLDERLSLADLTLALDNELLVSGNGIHQAALISYKNEIQHLQVLAEQACRERDKVKADLELADHRNLQLVREVDDRHASMETSNQSRIRDLEQDFRDRLVAQRGQLEQESDAQLQQTERERRTLEAELQLIRAREGELQDELCSVTQENSRLEEELAAVKMKLSEEEASVSKLQSDLDQLLHDRFGSLDPAAAGLSHEERFSEIIKEYEQQCRELRDRNDELSSELELLKSHRSSRKSRRSTGDPAPSWSVGAESDSDESDMKRNLSPLVRKKLQPPDKTALCSLDSVSGPAVSIQTELALEQLEQKHNQELQQLRIQLDTQVNYYERSLERMRQSMEVERKDISQAFKLEISELEEQKAQVERQVKQLKETLENLQVSPGGGGRSHEEERRMQRERAELEQNFAREIGNLVQRLSAEKDQLEAELKLKMDQEVMLVRMQLEEVQSENGALQERLGVLQQEVQNLEDDVAKKRRKLEEMEREHGRSRQEEERLHGENARYREEVLGLSSRNLQLSNDNAELSARLRGDQESVRMLTERLASVTKEQQEEGSEVQRMRVAALQQEVEWTREKQQLERDVTSYKEKLSRLMALEAELSGANLKLQRLEDDKNRLMREADGRNDEVETLRRALTSLEAESDQLRSDLHAADQNQQGHTQEVTDLQRKLQQAQNKVEDLETSVEKLMRDNQELHRALEEQQERTSRTLQEETHKLRVQNQELQQELAGLQVQSVEVQKLTQEQQNLKTKLNELETARIRAQEQALQADTTLSLVQAQHVRELQQLQTDDGYRGQSGLLKARLQQEQRRSQQLEESLRLQTQQSSAQIGMKQDQYEKAMSALQQRTEELETKLKGIRLVLQEKVQQLKDQLAANAKCSARLKDLHAENSQLMAALQVTEQRQKKAEKKNVQLEDKVHALSKLLREIVHVSLAT